MPIGKLKIYIYFPIEEDLSWIYLEPSKKPVNLLIKKINSHVNIKLKNNIEYRGKMVDCDSHMNIILDGATEYRNNTATANLGNVILRGSNILFVCINPAEGK